MAGVYGTVVSRGDVEQAIMATINLWLEAMLEDFEVERNLGFESIPRIGPVGVYSGLDAETFQQSNLPAVIVNCEPVDQPEVHGDGIYQQWYEATIICLSESSDEIDARSLADAYGTAVMGSIGQHGSLGDFALDTRLELSPNAKFLDPDKRRFGMSETVFRTLVPVMNRRGGPATPPPIGQQPSAWPTVESVEVTLDAIPSTDPLP